MVDKLNLLNQYEPVRHQIVVNLLDALAKLCQVERDLPMGADNLSKDTDNLSDGVGPQLTVETTLWGRVVIDAHRCTNCQFCSKFCPTGALQSQIDKTCGELRITHTPALCVQCGLCVDICQTEALSLNCEVAVSDLNLQTACTVYRAKVANLTTYFDFGSTA